MEGGGARRCYETFTPLPLIENLPHAYAYRVQRTLKDTLQDCQKRLTDASVYRDIVIGLLVSSIIWRIGRKHFRRPRL